MQTFGFISHFRRLYSFSTTSKIALSTGSGICDLLRQGELNVRSNLVPLSETSKLIYILNEKINKCKEELFNIFT